MFNEKILSAFLGQFPDHRIEVTGRVVEGTIRWTGRILGLVGGKDVVVAEAEELDLTQIPCAMADSLRHRLADARGVDSEELPASQRAALKDGIPGVVRKRGVTKDIEPLVSHGARTG